jgi:radical SAM protein with 4Fe4S-binding SPASM domain
MLDIKFKLTPSHTSGREWMAPSPLVKLFWNVTYACNFRCPICFTDSGRPHPDELSTVEAKAMLTQAAAVGVRDIIISGWEPFVRPDLVELLAHMAQVGITGRIASNGSLLDDEVLDRLRGETLVKSFQISLDTLDPAVYSAEHGASARYLDVALERLRRVQARGFHTTVSARLTPRTLPGLPALLDRACQEGWSTVTVHLPLHTRRAESALPQDRDMLRAMAPVFEHFCQLSTRWLVETYIPWGAFHPTIGRLERDARVVHCGCRAGRDRLSIQPDGAITPCVCMDVPAARIGNVRTDRLDEVFRDAPLCQLLRRPQEYGVCAECPNVTVCGAGCRAAAFAATGELDGQDPACPVWQTRVQAREAKSHAVN